jgi:hypothetical protein
MYGYSTPIGIWVIAVAGAGAVAWMAPQARRFAWMLAGLSIVATALIAFSIPVQKHGYRHATATELAHAAAAGFLTLIFASVGTLVIVGIADSLGQARQRRQDREPAR